MSPNSIFNIICAINKSTTFLHSFLPIIYAVILLLFIVLGITGIILFSMGKRFKNTARDIYGLLHFTTTFINMLIIFHLTYCSLVIPSNPINIQPTTEPLIRKRQVSSTKDNQQDGPPPSYNSIQTGGLKFSNNLTNLITKVIESINALIENNTVPFILVQVLCATIIVIVSTFTSAIFKGISKAGYEMHCRESNQVFTIPWWANLVDIFMYLLLIISSVFLVLYFVFKMGKDAFTTVTAGFGLIPSEDNKKSLSIQEVITDMGSKIDNPDVHQAVMETSKIINEWPRMKALFVISLSYYIIQLFLRMIEDIISNNIVLLTRWQKRETECSDEPNKESKTSMERGFILFCNIIILIATIIVTIIVLIVNFWFFPMIRQAIVLVYDKYPPIANTINSEITKNSLEKAVDNVSNHQMKLEPLINELNSGIATATDSNGTLDIGKLFRGNPQDNYHNGAITKSKTYRPRTTLSRPNINVNTDTHNDIKDIRDTQTQQQKALSTKNAPLPTSSIAPLPTSSTAPTTSTPSPRPSLSAPASSPSASSPSASVPAPSLPSAPAPAPSAPAPAPAPSAPAPSAPAPSAPAPSAPAPSAPSPSAPAK